MCVSFSEATNTIATCCSSNKTAKKKTFQFLHFQSLSSNFASKDKTNRNRIKCHALLLKLFFLSEIFFKRNLPLRYDLNWVIIIIIIYIFPFDWMWNRKKIICIWGKTQVRLFVEILIWEWKKSNNKLNFKKVEISF